jgi:hypothetical protein
VEAEKPLNKSRHHYFNLKKTFKMQNFKMQDYGLTPLSYTDSLNTDGGCFCSDVCDFFRGLWDGLRGK